MKKSFLFLLICAFPLLSFGQTHSINKFYRQYKGEDGAVSFAVPGLLIRAAAHIAPWFVDKEEKETRAAIRMGKKIKKTRVLVMEESNPINPEDLSHLVQKVRKDNYEELITVRADGERVNIFVRDRKNKLRNLLILVSSEDSFVMLSMKTRLKYDQLFEMINDFIDLDKEEDAEEVPTEPEPLEVIRA